MSELAIQIHQVSKCYKLYQSSLNRLKEVVHPCGRKYHQEFWALQDINLSIQQGQTLGIIGRNGSGKSTLLQIVAGVLSATQGWVALEGRVSALLELGAGFNTEFTGRDNVVVNGAVLGFTRQEMEERMPAIIEFSELHDFIDQPVKTYSSGMYIRLAFAAAVHVDPSILIVDEALSVGDARFQSKCNLKFEEFRKAGKTILLVSHSNSLIHRFCDSVVLMDSGKMLAQGPPDEILDQYTALLQGGQLRNIDHQSFQPNNEGSEQTEPSTMPAIGASQVVVEAMHPEQARQLFIKSEVAADCCHAKTNYNQHEHRYGSHEAEIVDYLLIVGGRVNPQHVYSNQPLELLLKIHFHQAVQQPAYGVLIKTLNGFTIYGSESHLEQRLMSSKKAGETAVIRIRLPLKVLTGHYFISAAVSARKTESEELHPLDRRQDMIHLEVLQENQVYGLVDFNATVEDWSHH